MARKLLALAACIMISLMTLPSAHARVLPVVIHCSASGSGIFWGDYDTAPPAWEDIVAKGACAAETPGMAFTVTLTGSGADVALIDVVRNPISLFELKARLTSLKNGRSKTYPQEWIRVVAKWIITNPIFIPVGFGSVTYGPPVRTLEPQKLNFAWTFLAFQTP